MKSSMLQAFVITSKEYTRLAGKPWRLHRRQWKGTMIPKWERLNTNQEILFMCWIRLISREEPRNWTPLERPRNYSGKIITLHIQSQVWKCSCDNKSWPDEKMQRPSFTILLKCRQTETSRRRESAGCFQGKHSILYLQATIRRIVHDPLRQLWWLDAWALYQHSQAASWNNWRVQVSPMLDSLV